MAKEPESTQHLPEEVASAAAAAIVAPWEAEVERFWQNVVLNVSTKVETPIHNFLHAEKEALKARLKQLL